MDRMYFEEMTEVNVDGAVPTSHWAVDIDNNSIEWIETQRRGAALNWALWDSSATSAGDSHPTAYCTKWYNNYRKFDVKKGGC